MSLTLLHATNSFSHLRYPVQAQPSFGSNVDDTSVSDFFIMEEIWKDIPGYKGFYQVSNFGRVKALRRQVFNMGKYRYRHSQTLKNSLHRGYHRVTLNKESLRNSFLVHRLVAMAFIPNPENKPHINHINFITTDNRPENLEWCTPDENVAHTVEHGRNAKGEKMGIAKLSDCDANNIKNSILDAEELASIYGIGVQHIKNIITGKSWKHLE